MIQDCKYNPITDIQEVVPDMSIDIDAAVESGVVLDLGVVAEPNGIEDVNSIQGRVRDVFDAMVYESKLHAASEAAAAGSSPAVTDKSATE